MRRLYPRQNQKACVIGDEANIALPGFHAPADIAITTAQVARRRTPGHAGNRPPLRPHQMLQMLAHWLLVAEVVMMLEQAVEQWLIAGPADLLHFERAQLVHW